MLTYNKNHIDVQSWVFSYILKNKLNILHLGGIDIDQIIKFKNEGHYILALEENNKLFEKIKNDIHIPAVHSDILSLECLETEKKFDLIWAYDSFETYSYKTLYDIIKNIQLLLKKDSLFYISMKKQNKSIPLLIHIMHHFEYVNLDSYFEKKQNLNHFIFKKS